MSLFEGCMSFYCWALEDFYISWWFKNLIDLVHQWEYYNTISEKICIFNCTFLKFLLEKSIMIMLKRWSNISKMYEIFTKTHVLKVARKQIRGWSRRISYTCLSEVISNVFTLVILTYILEVTNLWPRTSVFRGANAHDLGGSERILRAYNKEYIR